ncbi:unnamed protein product [Triticum turgidum subsp. durum]|uniref:Uncharacterized protein n=1 Tax=Triticum turgidum subsp. durum TaxID=4567 RepID=A0A9R1C5M2_TRITD|nr:unnamed protein product [Triticum turgidum subsp. durum]
MENSSDDDSEISDSEIDEYEGKFHARLVSGDLKFRNGDSYSCPFCTGRKNKDYNMQSLLQHSSGVGAAPNRPAKDKASHRALAKHLKNGVAKPSEPQQPQQIAIEPQQLQQIAIEPQQPQPLPNRHEKFVWPWMGVLVNVPTEWKDGRQVGESGNRLKGELSQFCPLKVIPLWNFRGHTGNAIVEFAKNWNGFRNALAFEKYFEAGGCGRRDWKQNQNQGSKLCGWVARAEDYNFPGLIGDHLRKNADLKTIDDLENEGTRKNNKLVANLANQIEVKNKYLQELELRYNETTVSLEKMMGQREQRLQAYNEEIRKMQQLARRHSEKIIDENQNLRSELESKMSELNARSKELDDLAAKSSHDKSNLEQEKQKNAIKSNHLKLATAEQQRADEDVVKLVRDQKREKVAALNKILELEQQLEAKQTLELEIQQLKGKLEVMKHMPGHEDSVSKDKINELSEELQDKMDELDAMESLNQTLVIKESKSNTEMQEARKELENGLLNLPGGRAHIGIKRMGELDLKAVSNVLGQKLSKEDAEVTAAILCSKWEAEIRNPEWHPFRAVMVDGKEMERINADDAKLRELKDEHGEEIYSLVIKALREYNANSTRYPVGELWNFREERKASLKEAVQVVNIFLGTCYC